MRCLDDLAFRFLRVVAPFVRLVLPMRCHRTITLREGRSSINDASPYRRGMPTVQLAAHPATCTKLLIIYPGLNATLDGESRQFTQSHPYRFLRLAKMLQSAGVAAVIRVANPPSGYDGDGQVAVDRLRRAVDFAREHARALCGHRKPELCFLGFSAGAGGSAALAGQYQPVRMMLIAPSGDVGPQRIVDGLKEYAGMLTILCGEKDEIVGRDAAILFGDLSPATLGKHTVIVHDCDHFFTSEEHNRLLEETVWTAFAENDDWST